MRGRRLLWVVLAVLVYAFPAAAGAAGPNILFVLTDDQRRDTLSVMPAVRANFDVSFSHAVVSTPECCPSRVSLLTGEYMHHHLVTSNFDHTAFSAREADSLAPWLQQQGYYTIFIGKYLNRYQVDEPVPPGWDEFYARVWNPDGTAIGNGQTSLALSHSWSEDGATHDEVLVYPDEQTPSVYATRLFSDLAVAALERAHDPRFNPGHRPWALFVWTTAPHRPLVVDGPYRAADVPPWNPPPSYLEKDMTDKPLVVRQNSFAETDSYPFADDRAGRLRMLMSVDDLVEDVWNAIDMLGEREATWGLFSSDNGLLTGEHWLRRKFFAYEESIRVPFRMAVPGRGAATTPRALVANIDVAPTILDIAGGARRTSFDGRSLLDLALGAENTPCFCRRPIMLENAEFVRYEGLRLRWWKYVLWPSGNEELYNLRQDPYELENLARKSAYQDRLRTLRRTLDRLRAG